MTNMSNNHGTSYSIYLNFDKWKSMWRWKLAFLIMQIGNIWYKIQDYSSSPYTSLYLVPDLESYQALPLDHLQAWSLIHYLCIALFSCALGLVYQQKEVQLDRENWVEWSDGPMILFFQPTLWSINEEEKELVHVFHHNLDPFCSISIPQTYLLFT